MAITYFAIDSTDPEGTHNLDCPASVSAKLRGIVRIWAAGTPDPTPTGKFVVVGDDIALSDSSRLRSISTQLKSRMLNSFQQMMNMSKADLASYGRSLGRSFRADIVLSSTDAGNI